jgi:hypothetical protein
MSGWWDPSDASSITLVSDLVSQMNDKSGNGLHATQATGGSQPGYGAARERKINGIIVPDYDRGDALNTSLTATSTTFTAFAVGVGDVFNGQSGATTLFGSEGRMMQIGDGGSGVDTSYGFLNFYGGSVFSVMSSPTIFTGESFVVGIRWTSGSALKMAVNDSRFSTTNAAGSPNGVFGIGRRPNQNWDGGIGEVILYDTTALDDVTFDQTMSYLMNKWGVG